MEYVKIFERNINHTNSVFTEATKILGFVERKFVQSGSSLLKQRDFKDVRILEQQINIHMNNFVNLSFDFLI